jgi:pilus assembly protein FimV
VEERGSRHFVLVTSTQSVNEPFIEILLELNSSSGKLTREYTMLIDPLEMQASNAASSSDKSITAPSSPVMAAQVPSVTPIAPTNSATSAPKSIEKTSNPAP